MSARDVFLAGRRVGVLAHRSEAGDATEFRLDAAYRDDPERPVLGQVFEDEPDRVWRSTLRLPAWFSNLLPEGRLRTLLAAQAGVNEERELHLLAALGEDLPGAVTVAPRPGVELESAPIRPATATVDPEERLRFSLAGLQLKFAVNLDERGPTVPVRGLGGRWIAKLPDPRYAEVPRNEAATLTWAGMSGIDVPEHRLVETSEIEGLPRGVAGTVSGPSLLVRRFDRAADGTRVHIEDFAQVLGAVGERDKYDRGNYETIGRILFELCGEPCFEQYVRRLAFMVVSGSADLHLKNWSLLYADGRRATPSPAYDLVATRVFMGPDETLALKLDKRRLRFQEVSRDAFRRLATKVGVEPGRVDEWVQQAVSAGREAWPEVRSLLPRGQAADLESHLSKLIL